MALFLAAAYLAAVVVFAFPLLSESGIGALPIELPGIAPFIVLASLGLLGATVLATVLTGGRSATTELRKRIFRFRVAPGWYLLALTLLPLAGLLTAVIAVGVDPVRHLLSQPDLLLGAVVLEAIVAFLLVNWWEEAAWTGFVVHRLQPRIGPMRTSIVTTWLQAVIHLPLVFIADGVTDGRVQTDQVPFYLAALFLLPIPVRVIITWLYNTTGSSVPVVGLFHAGLGVATGSPPGGRTRLQPGVGLRRLCRGGCGNCAPHAGTTWLPPGVLPRAPPRLSTSPSWRPERRPPLRLTDMSPR